MIWQTCCANFPPSLFARMDPAVPANSVAVGRRPTWNCKQPRRVDGKDQVARLERQLGVSVLAESAVTCCCCRSAHRLGRGMFRASAGCKTCMSLNPGLGLAEHSQLEPAAVILEAAPRRSPFLVRAREPKVHDATIGRYVIRAANCLPRLTVYGLGSIRGALCWKKKDAACRVVNEKRQDTASLRGSATVE